MLIAHITDTHVRPAGALAYGRVDTNAMLARCVAQLGRLQPQPDLVVFTGDLVDGGKPEEYALLQSLLAPLRAPLLVIPGNHDERKAMRAAFATAGYLPASGFLQYTVDDRFALRIIGLDTIIPLKGGGELCAQRLAWLASQLEARPQQPTLLLMHHPPFETGIGHPDDTSLRGREAFAALVARHPQIQAILCGHLHRSIHALVGGRRAFTCPSPAHQVTLDLRADAPACFSMEPPGYMLHWWNEASGQLVTHTAVVGDYPGPYPF